MDKTESVAKAGNSCPTGVLCWRVTVQALKAIGSPGCALAVPVL